MYDIPSRSDVKQCVVTAASIEGEERPHLLNSSGKPIPEEPPVEIEELIDEADETESATA